MFNFDSFFDYIGDKKKPNLFAMHFRRLEAYNSGWDIKKILLYEYMLICARKHSSKGKRFTQKYSMIMDATKMGRNSVSKYLTELENDGYLNVKREESKGVRQLNWYMIDYECIKKSLEQIYNFGDLDQKDVETYKKELKKWYDYHAKTSYRDAKGVKDSDNDDPDGDISITG